MLKEPLQEPYTHIGLGLSPFFDKQSGLMDMPGLSLIRDRIHQRRKKKRLATIVGLAARQGKANKTMRFKYTNAKGVSAIREITPYEIKDGFLWGVDIKDPGRIKRYFVDKIHNARPGIKKFEPAWPVKFASQEDLLEKRAKITLNVEKGDTVLMGRFKNMKVKVKKISKDDHGMPTINGKKAATFRYSKDSEKVGMSRLGLKNRLDRVGMLVRNYDRHMWNLGTSPNPTLVSKSAAVDKHVVAASKAVGTGATIGPLGQSTVKKALPGAETAITGSTPLGTSTGQIGLALHGFKGFKPRKIGKLTDVGGVHGERKTLGGKVMPEDKTAAEKLFNMNREDFARINIENQKYRREGEEVLKQILEDNHGE